MNDNLVIAADTTIRTIRITGRDGVPPLEADAVNYAYQHLRATDPWGTRRWELITAYPNPDNSVDVRLRQYAGNAAEAES